MYRNVMVLSDFSSFTLLHLGSFADGFLLTLSPEAIRQQGNELLSNEGCQRWREKEIDKRVGGVNETEEITAISEI